MNDISFGDVDVPWTLLCVVVVDLFPTTGGNSDPTTDTLCLPDGIDDPDRAEKVDRVEPDRVELDRGPEGAEEEGGEEVVEGEGEEEAQPNPLNPSFAGRDSSGKSRPVRIILNSHMRRYLVSSLPPSSPPIPLIPDLVTKDEDEEALAEDSWTASP